MSNYTATTNFASKDTLVTGDPDKVIKGSEFQTEFDAIESMSATKADKVSPATADNVLSMDVNGNLKNSGIASSNVRLKSDTIPVSGGGTGATTAADARTNLGLGTLATRNSVGAAQIDDGSVGSAELGASAVKDANVTKTTTAGSQSIGFSASWVPAAGIYVFVVPGSTTVNLDIYDGATWRANEVGFGGGLVLCDGTNMRFTNNDTTTRTVYYRKLA